MPKISNNLSGERRGAGLKWRSPRHDEIDRDAIEMLDGSRNERHRQLRRRRQERVRGEKDRGADHAIVVVRVIAGVRRGQLRRLGSRAAYSRSGVAAMDAVEMDMPERDNELQRQRGQRQPTAKPSIVKPTHRAVAIPRGQPRPYSISLARAPRSHNAVASAHKPIGAGCGAEVTVAHARSDMDSSRLAQLKHNRGHLSDRAACALAVRSK